MRNRKMKSKRILAMLLALTLNVTTVFGAAGVTAYATESTEQTVDVEDDRATENDTAKVDASEDTSDKKEDVSEADEEQSNSEEADDEEEESSESDEEYVHICDDECEDEEHEEETTEALTEENDMIALASVDEEWKEAKLCEIKPGSEDITDNVYTSKAANGKKIKIAAYTKDGELKNLSTGGSGFVASNWKKGDYYQVSLSTKFFKDNVMSLYLRSTKTSVKDFHITYSVDGGKKYKDLKDYSFDVSTSAKTVTLKDLELKDADDCSEVVIRIECSSDTAVSGGDIQSGGNTNLNNIVITGLTNGKVEEDNDDDDAKEPAYDGDPIKDDMIPEGVHTIDYILDNDNFDGTGKDKADTTQKATASVIGQITHIYGNGATANTAAISDVIDGKTVSMIVYFNKTEFTAKVGDVITASGLVKDYGKVRQIQDISEVNVINDTTDAFEAKEYAIKDVMSDAHVSEYVLLKNVTIGAYDAKNTTVKDDNGDTINIYQGYAFPETVKAGDVIDLYAIASKYNTSYQLRVGSKDCYVFVKEGEKEEEKEDQEFTDPVSDDMIPEGCNTIDNILTDSDKTIKNDDGTYTVIGQIATKFGNYNTLNSCVIEDVIDGQLYALQIYDKLADYNIGDVVTVTGELSEYGKVKQVQKLTGKELISDKKDLIEARVVDLDDLNSDKYISQYVVVKNVILGEYVSNGNTKFTDSKGREFPIYRAATYPEGAVAGDKADIYGVSSRYNDTFQMRVGYATDYKVAGKVEVDADYVLGIASIRGSFEEDLKTEYVYGDLYKENDQLDKNTKLTMSEAGVPMISNPSNGVTTRNLGTKALKAGSYYTIETSSLGYGAMNLDFQMRGSKKGPRDFQVLYSTDGKNFEPAGKTNVKASYTVYLTSTETQNVNVDKDGSNGEFALTADGKWHEISVAIPDGAANAEKLYIRVQVKTDSLSVDGNAINGGTNYFTTISLTGSPVVADNICGFVKVSPEEGEIKANQELTFTSSTKDATIYYAINDGEFKTYDENSKPVIKEEDFPASVTCYAKKDKLADSLKITYHFTKGQVATVKASPNGGAVKENTTVQLTCATEGASIEYSLDEGTTWLTYENGIKLQELPVTLQARASLEGYEASEVASFVFTKRSQEDYNAYFGQIHSHTSYSDGAGTAEQAFQYASEEADHIDFLAITDHSNSFDNDTSANIKDGSASSEWVEGHEIADKFTKEQTEIIVNNDDTTEDADATEVNATEPADEDYFVGIMGYEMTWSGGAPGHMNTFNTDGFMSRNMSGYGNGSKSSLTNYYGQLKTVPNAFSMFNHPGTTFGDFYDFGYYDEEIDNYITLIEVGNGEGAIGSSGYFPSYEYYTRALDKGWHVAPTNDQDNHKGKWGDANTGRTVILADTLTRDNIYDALRNMRVYATEDNDLQIQYTMNGMDMGYIYDDAPDSCDIVVKVDDPTDSKIGKVEVIVNNGLAIASETVNDSSATLKFNLKPDYSYYYIRVTQPDGDKAVTAPVWVSDVEALGISSLTTDASLEVKDEPINLNLGLYNNEDKDFDVESIIYTVDGEIVHKTDLEKAELTKLGAKKEATDSFAFTYDKVGKVTVTATMIGKLNGVTKTYTKDLELTYIDPSMVTRVIVDGTHNNDYVSGYYGGNVGNFADIAAESYVQVNVVTDEITDEMLEDCAVLVLSAPAKKNGTYNGSAYAISHFEDSFVEKVKKYVNRGGNVILCGLADYQDSADSQSSTEINKVLEAIGATNRLNSDEIVDDEKNGGQNYRLYFDDFNMSSPYLQGVTKDQTYSAYSGASVLVGENGEALVYGHDSTYSIDSKKVDSNYKDVEKGKIVALAHESLASGSEIFVAGTVFISDFEVKSDLDNASDSYYANRNILLNILSDIKDELPISTIAQMRAGKMGDIFAIEGYVTAGNSNPDTTFFDAIYVQDDTAGTTVFPFSDTDGTVEIGTKVQIVGFVDAYQGDKEIQVISAKVLGGEKHVYEPAKVSAKDAMDYDKNGGSLLQVTGKVTRVVKNSSGVDYFYVQDESGAEARIFIDGYILASNGKDTVNEDVKVGNTITAAGLCYMNPDGVCLRVRDRVEVTTGTLDDITPSAGDDSQQTSGSSDKKKHSSNKSTVVKDKVETVEISNTIVPLAAELPTMADSRTSFKVELSSECELKAQVYAEYAGLKALLLSYVNHNVGISILGEDITTTDANVNFSNTVTELNNFADGFDTICMMPYQEAKLPFKVGININLGAQYAGKYAYIYQKDMTTGLYEFAKVMVVNEIGNVDLYTDAFTNVIVMIAK